MYRSTQVRPLDDRRSTRSDVRLAATLEAGPAHNVAITIVNISAHGIMAECTAPLLPGRPVSLSLPGLYRHAGRIAWVRDDRLGIAFDRPLALAEIMSIL